MAGDDTTPDERQFEPTQRRKDEFRREGRVAVSKDLASTAQLGAVVIGFMLLGNALFAAIAGAMRWVMTHVGEDQGQRLSFGDVVAAHLDTLLVPTLALCGVFLVATALSVLAQTNFLFAGKAIGFKWDRLNGFKRLGDLFGPKKATVRVLLAMAKVALTGFIITLLLAEIMPQIAGLGMGSLEGATRLVKDELWSLLLTTVAVLGVLAVVDLVWQRRQMGQQLRMTREELKKETEDDEGRPEIKAKRKAKHREFSLNRIMKEVPNADVVVTNPTHFAVALRYRPGHDKAPVVVAKGQDELAAHIRAIARRHGVPILENRPLARALYKTVKVGKPVPESLVTAVARVLAQVYTARRTRLMPAAPPTRR